MGDIPIVMYHAINNHPEASPLGFLAHRSEELREHLRYFVRNGYTFVTLSELWGMAENGSLGDRPVVALTFDDGYLDNLLIAEKVLEEFRAKGTVFVTLDFVGKGSVRTLEEVPDAWGYLNEAEIQSMADRGVFEFQCHTMTHDREFCSDRVIDLYRRERFDKYHWLAWRLDPEGKPDWLARQVEYKESLPAGYPIFESDRAIRAWRFIPDEAFIDVAKERFEREGLQCIESLNAIKKKGEFESKDAWRERVTYELAESKLRLEKLVRRPVDFLCFPGGGYDEEAVGIARACGYRAYIVNSEDRCNGNLRRLREGVKDSEMVALSRVTFSKDFPAMLRGRVSAYLSCKVGVERFLDRPWAKVVNWGVKLTRDGLRLLGWGRRNDG